MVCEATRVRRGFSLIELVAALGASSVLVLALSSVLFVARGAVPGPDDPASARLSSWGAVERLGYDLSTATAIAGSGGGPWTLTVPDRTGDAVAETVVWSWDGSGAEPSFELSRAVNGGEAEVVLADVKSAGVTRAGGLATVTLVVGDGSASVTMHASLLNMDRE